MKEFEIGNEKEKKIIIEGIMGDEKLYKNPMDPRLEHMFIFLEQKENLYAICRNPTLSDTYEESFENIEEFIENRISNINSKNTKRLFLIPFSTKNGEVWHAQLLVGDEKTFVIDQQNKILFKLENCNLFDSNYERLYTKQGQNELLNFTFLSKTNEKYPKVISTSNNITESACAVCVVGASRFFARQHNEAKNLYESIVLISSDMNSIKELLTNIHSLRDIKEVTKNTGYYNFVYFNEATKNVDIKNGFVPFIRSNAGKIDENFYKITIERPAYEEHGQIIRNRLIKSFNKDEMLKSANKLAETINNGNNNNIRNRRKHSII